MFADGTWQKGASALLKGLVTIVGYVGADAAGFCEFFQTSGKRGLHLGRSQPGACREYGCLVKALQRALCLLVKKPQLLDCVVEEFDAQWMAKARGKDIHNVPAPCHFARARHHGHARVAKRIQPPEQFFRGKGSIGCKIDACACKKVLWGQAQHKAFHACDHDVGPLRSQGVEGSKAPWPVHLLFAHQKTLRYGHKGTFPQGTGGIWVCKGKVCAKKPCVGLKLCESCARGCHKDRRAPSLIRLEGKPCQSGTACPHNGPCPACSACCFSFFPAHVFPQHA